MKGELTAGDRSVIKDWTVSSVGKELNFQYGKGLPKKERSETGKIPVYGSNGIVGYTDKALTDQESIIVGRKGSAGALNLCEGPSWTTDVAYFVENSKQLDLKFLYLLLDSLDLPSLAKGVKPGLSRKDAYALEIKIPHLKEQKRIVAKVDELMTLCDELVEQNNHQSLTSKNFSLSTFNALTKPEDFENWANVKKLFFDYFPRHTEDRQKIKQMRQTILNLAVSGRVTQKLPNDGEISTLISDIQTERENKIKTKQIKNNKVNKELNHDNLPKIPEYWHWIKLGLIGDWGSGSTPSRSKPEYYTGTFTWLKSGELNDNMCLQNSEEKISQQAIDNSSFRRNKRGDVLIAMYGATIGSLAILGEDAVTNQAVCGCTPFAGVDNKYLFYFLSSYREDFTKAGAGGAQPNISKEKIINTPFPLPPLKEQNRIVSKVDELMSLCDQLEASLENETTIKADLLKSLIA